MNGISFIGLLALVLIAWLLSTSKRKIKIRPIIWGILLQIIFALIILRKDYISFIGMMILGSLIIFYLTVPFWYQQKKWNLAPILLVSFLTGTILFLLPQIIPWTLAIVCLASLVFYLRRYPATIPSSLLVISTISFFISRNLTGQAIFNTISTKIAFFLNLSNYGARFLFGNLVDPKYFFPEQGSSWPGFGFQFALRVLPTIIFFGGFMGILYHLGIMQKIIVTISRFMKWTIGTSGAETLSCSANIFVGQTEAPLLIKPFLPSMTPSELGTIMVGGFATIAGGVLAGYISMGVPAGHLIAASVMSAPAALAIGKLIFPELHQSKTAGDVTIPDIKTGSNLLESASNGITDGLKLAVNVGAMLLGFIALIAVLDLILNWLDSIIDGTLLGGKYVSYKISGLSPAEGEYLGIFPGSLQKFFGTILRPLAFLMGVPWKDASFVGNLLGIKLSLNEFVAYGTLGNYIQSGVVGERAIIISTYALCGFANFSSIGIQLGGISSLAPERKRDLSKVALKAMLGGAIASWMTATIAGIFI